MRRCTKSLNGRYKSTMNCTEPLASTPENACPAIWSSGEARRNVSAPAGDVNFQLAGLEVGKACVGRADRDAADSAGDQVRRHSFIAKFRPRGQILHTRPSLPVVQRHSIEGASRQKQSAAVAKREMPDRALDHHVGTRQV